VSEGGGVVPGSGKIFTYNGTNQNTISAWIRIDTPEKENIEVEVKDNFGSYSWHRQKSNDNVKGKIEDGKGFSFFFARYAYFDKFIYEDESFSTSTDLNHSAILAVVPFKNIISFNKDIINDENIMKKLHPSNAVLLLINTQENKNTKIISATYTEKKEYLIPYIEHRSEILMKEHEKVQKIPKSQQWLREKLTLSVEEKLYRMLTEGYEQFKDFLTAAKELEEKDD
jgi:hypothetical protein